MEPDALFNMTLPEARRIVQDPSHSTPAAIFASHSICESPDATLNDLFACASLRERSAAWRPAHLLHERTGVAKQFDKDGFIVIDLTFWRDYLSKLQNYTAADAS